eukprot:CAMPEP_0185692618 /NCGR_PEP_ID=MMETSP1164-20130828/2657_1 /TAXON_ID=1104430 /ORGANISM="Chrysoreinhardia sp, Strain CCMP2950" /LENGTH=178 /DNA_ID=CAMNT_0028359357 /DNA_START=401 /DNA_END=935 /DNA_ORIENTATION=-
MPSGRSNDPSDDDDDDQPPRLVEADDELEDHDEEEDGDADVHVEGLPRDGDLLGVLGLLADRDGRLVDVRLESVEEPELRLGLLVDRLPDAADAVDALAEPRDLLVLAFMRACCASSVLDMLRASCGRVERTAKWGGAPGAPHDGTTTEADDDDDEEPPSRAGDLRYHQRVDGLLWLL